jgi:hypothetical protein
MKTFKIEGYRIRAFPGGKTEVFKGRKRIGVWWVSAPSYVHQLFGEDLEANANTALEAAKSKK